MSTARLTVRVNESLRHRLALVAKCAGKRESEIVRDAIEDYLTRQPPVRTCHDVFKAAGAIGLLKGGPYDLSTNPNYMEDFGRD